MGRTRAEGRGVRTRAVAWTAVALAAGWGGFGTLAQERVFIIDADQSRVVIDVGKAGLFSFAGHTHEVVARSLSGRVVYDPVEVSRSSITLEIDATALQVTGQGEPAGDVPEVQETMLSERVLDVSRFPMIAFASRQVVVAGREDDRLKLRVVGDLTLHGVSRPVSCVVDVVVGQDDLTSTGSFTLKQTDFGIEPVTAAAGTVRVKNELDIHFSLHARG